MFFQAIGIIGALWNCSYLELHSPRKEDGYGQKSVSKREQYELFCSLKASGLMTYMGGDCCQNSNPLSTIGSVKCMCVGGVCPVKMKDLNKL